MGADDDKHWKVGELASATGLTVRTLHHYDDIGLLLPSQRTFAGHRRYAEAEVQRLYRILAWRRLGLGLEEIAALLDEGGVSLVETVRRHLGKVERELEHQHILRDHLRRMLAALERSIEPSVDEYIDALEAMTMMEAVVDDVVMHLEREQRVVLLRERSGDRVLPIFVGAPEGDALVYQRSGLSTPRPLGPDLTAALLQAGGVQVERVVIESLRDNTYFATVVVVADDDSHEVDARPSDALNLASRLGVPVFVASEVMDRAGMDSKAVLESGHGPGRMGVGHPRAHPVTELAPERSGARAPDDRACPTGDGARAGGGAGPRA